MLFDWDAFNVEHMFERHGILPFEAEQVMVNDPIEYGANSSRGEKRALFVGETNSGRVLFVVVTLRRQSIRIITARPASKIERHFLERHRGES